MSWDKGLRIGRRFRRDEYGAAIVEYSMLIAIVGAATIGAIVLVSVFVGAEFEEWYAVLSGAPG